MAVEAIGGPPDRLADAGHMLRPAPLSGEHIPAERCPRTARGELQRKAEAVVVAAAEAHQVPVRAVRVKDALLLPQLGLLA
jgi:hypothetical protein